MVTAIVLLNAAKEKVNPAAEALSAIDGISEVYSVAGRYDLIAVVRVADNDKLAAVVTEHIRTIDGLTASECSPLEWTRKPDT
jgi:DNA-binding Lrp family transcriptional regulator